MMVSNKEPRLFAGCFASPPDSEGCRLVFVGLPDDSQSSYRRGCSKAPERIRVAYNSDCYNSCTESGIDLEGAVADLRDIPSNSSWSGTAKAYRDFAANLFRVGKVPFFAGGDHAVTVPIIAALATKRKPIHFVQVDAHPDLYAEYENNPDSHACVAARVLEMDHVASITQLGVRTMNPKQRTLAERHRDRLHVLSAGDLRTLPSLPHIPPDAPVYLSVDVDGFDPAFAPGVSHPVPGGLTPRQVLDFICSASWNLVGMDVVEVNPSLDTNDRTAILAARMLHEGMGQAAKQFRRTS